MTLDEARAIKPGTRIMVRGYMRAEGQEWLRWKVTRWLAKDKFRIVRPNGSRGVQILDAQLAERMQPED